MEEDDDAYDDGFILDDDGDDYSIDDGEGDNYNDDFETAVSTAISKNAAERQASELHVSPSSRPGSARMEEGSRPGSAQRHGSRPESATQSGSRPESARLSAAGAYVCA